MVSINTVFVGSAGDLSCYSNPGFSVIAPGCLAHPDDTNSSALLNTLALLKHKVRAVEGLCVL